MGDGLWHVLHTASPTGGTYSPPCGSVRYRPDTAAGYPVTGEQRAAQLVTTHPHHPIEAPRG